MAIEVLDCGSHGNSTLMDEKEGLLLHLALAFKVEPNKHDYKVIIRLDSRRAIAVVKRTGVVAS